MEGKTEEEDGTMHGDVEGKRRAGFSSKGKKIYTVVISESSKRGWS